MWIYIVTWSAYIVGLINFGNDKTMYGKPGLEKINFGTVYYDNRDSAMSALDKKHKELMGMYSTVKNLDQTKVTLDSVWIKDVNQKNVLYFKQ